jgi:hypothetical protein
MAAMSESTEQARPGDALAREALALWFYERFGPENMSAIIAHAGFVEALKRSTIGALGHYAADPTFSTVFKDLGRFYVGALCMHLHATPGGLTLSRLKALCHQSAFISATAAEALLAYMRDIHFFEPAAEQPDRRSLVLAPSAGLWGNFRERFRLEMEAAAQVEPALNRLLAVWDAPEVFIAFMAAHGRDSLTIAASYDPRPGGLGLLYERHAGPLLLMKLLAGARAEDSYPPLLPVPLSINALARTFEVSRTHVARFIEVGEKAGLFERQGKGRELLLTPVLRERLIYFYASTYAQTIGAGRETMATLGI